MDQPVSDLATRPARGAATAILLTVFQGIAADRIFLVAAGVAFYGIIALFPGIAATVSIYGLFANPTDIAAHLGTLSGVAPGGAVEVMHEELMRVAGQNGATLGFGFGVSLVVALWFANSGVTGLFAALNAVYEEQEQRGLVRYYAESLAFTVGGILLVLVALAIVVAIPVVLHHIPNAGITAILIEIARWPLLFLIVGGAASLAYRYAPSRSAPQWRWILVSAAAAAIVWLGASALFSWYVANFGSYNKTYGSLGAIFGFMTWIWLSMVIVLTGAKLDSELEKCFRR